MLFRSDNVTAVCPEVIEAILAVNQGDAAPYGADTVTAKLDDAFGACFEAPVHVHPVATGAPPRGRRRVPRSVTSTRM
jgi:threonine aldolase